jgi:hypothetical protein
MMRERQAPKEIPVVDMKPMNLTAATKISEEPLPTWFSSEDPE